MQIERLFNVLVLGGAAFGAGCSGSVTNPSGTSAAGGSDGGDGGSAGGATSASSGGTSPVGSAGNGGIAASGGTSAGAADAAALGCHIDSLGYGKLSDPCGCPCCWARDCLNTDDRCVGFCLGGDEGRGCCSP